MGDYERLVDAARSIDPRTLLIVLLGGDAGLRCGEMIALDWGDIDLGKRQLCVRPIGLERPRRNAEEWTAALRAAHETPRGGSGRPSAPAQPTRALPDGRSTVYAADRPEPDAAGGASGERAEGRTHPAPYVLLALAMRGAPAKAIQELAGYADLTMTQRYMHLSPAALDAAIQLLDRPGSDQKFGDLGETADHRPIG